MLQECYYCVNYQQVESFMTASITINPFIDPMGLIKSTIITIKSTLLLITTTSILALSQVITTLITNLSTIVLAIIASTSIITSAIASSITSILIIIIIVVIVDDPIYAIFQLAKKYLYVKLSQLPA